MKGAASGSAHPNHPGVSTIKKVNVTNTLNEFSNPLYPRLTRPCS
ncbi:hypothetical protein MTBLM5_90119 [Magnetospirillum sp. LM-5]|nr:hypothetical protein MTBLM5_90119 [Magnetospirillum sp. LM-5]